MAGQRVRLQLARSAAEGADPLPETGQGHPWIEFRLGNSSLMIFKLDSELSHRPAVHVPWVYVNDYAFLGCGGRAGGEFKRGLLSRHCGIVRHARRH